MKLIRINQFIFLLGLILINSCNSTVQSTSQTKTQQVQVTRLTALIFGKLVLDENKCLRVVTEQYGSPLLVWPPDYQAKLVGDLVHVKEGLVSGITAEYDLHIGDAVAFGGGEVDITSIDDSFYQVSAKSCPGPYWVFAGLAQK